MHAHLFLFMSVSLKNICVCPYVLLINVYFYTQISKIFSFLIFFRLKDAKLLYFLKIDKINKTCGLFNYLNMIKPVKMLLNQYEGKTNNAC